MIVEFFILYQIILIGIFFTAFFLKNEILWVMSLVFSGILMALSFNIEFVGYAYNATSLSYQLNTISYSYPYLMGINMIFFVLSLVLGLYDLLDKYGIGLMGSKSRQVGREGDNV